MLLLLVGMLCVVCGVYVMLKITAEYPGFSFAIGVGLVVLIVAVVLFVTRLFDVVVYK